MKIVVIIGAGELGRQLRHIMTQSSLTNSHLFLGWLDDTRIKDEMVDGFPVLGGLNQIEKLDKNVYFALGIGYNHLSFKQKLVDRLVSQGRNLLTIIHDSALVDPSSIIEAGAVVYPGCIIDNGVKVGKGTLLNNGVIISHDSAIGMASFLAPGVTLCGNVKVGARCFIGAGSILKDGVNVTDEVILGLGFNLFENIDEKGTYVQKVINRKL